MMKTKALKGFAALMVLLVVCFFFSGTARTLTTAKVMLTYPQLGRLKETLNLTGTLRFSATEDVSVSLPEGASLTITQVNVAPGMAVSAGDVLFETAFTGVEKLIAAQEEIYAAAQSELLTLERENNQLRLQRTEESWLAAYDALVDAYNARHDAEVALNVAANLRTGVEEAQSAYDEAAQAVVSAEKLMEKMNRTGIAEDVYAYTMAKRDIQARMDSTTANIVSLHTLEQSTRQIVAPHDGYVVAVNLSAGQSWDGQAALIMSAEGAEMLLRADASDLSHSISEGANVTVSGRFGTTVKTKVAKTGYDSHGEPFAEVGLSAKDATSLDTVAHLMSQGASMQFTYTATQTSYLLPAAALRGGEDNYSVYTVTESQNAFGQTILTVAEQKVTLLDEGGSMVSIDGIYDNVQVAYMEDRAISPGSEVMAYE